MSRRRAVLSLTVTTLVLAVMALASCGGGGSEQDEKAKARPLPEDHKALRPGEYRTEEFEPSLSFRVGEGWFTSPPEDSDVLQLEYGETAGLAFTNAQGVFKPTESGTTQATELPEDLAGWFQHHPYLKTGKPEPITVGGVEGVEFDVLVKDLPEDYYGVCGRGCVDIFSLSGGEQTTYFYESHKRRVVVLEDVQDDTVTIAFSSDADNFDEFAPEAKKVLDTVKWGGS